jgi:hypothetical protein
MSFHKRGKFTTKARRHKVFGRCVGATPIGQATGPTSQQELFKSVSMNGKSPGTVTFGFGVLLATSRTGWPINSHAAVSSVKIRFFCRAAQIARRMNSTLKV